MIVSAPSFRQHRRRGVGDVLDLGQYRFFETWFVCDRSVGCTDAHDGRVERPEAVFCRPRRDLCAEARGERVLVHHEEPAGSFGGFGHEIVVPGRERTEIHNLRVDPFSP